MLASAILSRRYGSTEIIEAIDITYRQLDYWTRRDFIRPSVQQARGSGSSREFSESDVFTIFVMQ